MQSMKSNMPCPIMHEKQWKGYLFAGQISWVVMHGSAVTVKIQKLRIIPVRTGLAHNAAGLVYKSG